MIQVALNGSRQESFVPRFPDELVISSIGAIDAGASSIHFNVRDIDGNETLQKTFVEEQISAIKKALPYIPAGISTGAWIESEFSLKYAHINSWKIVPDFVSLNFDEEGCLEIAELILKKNIGIEAGLSSLAATEIFLNSGISKKCLRILIEPEEQEINEAVANIEAIENELKNAGISAPVLLHGFNATCWPVLEIAFKKGLLTRIGFEDSLYLPGGGQARYNDEMVKAALDIKQNILKTSSKTV